MDGHQFDRLTRALAVGIGRRRLLGTLAAGVVSTALAGLGGRRILAQKDCLEDCPDGYTCRRGLCVLPCESNRDCRDRGGDACIGGSCRAGVCAQFIVDCAPGYVCCKAGECCPIACTTAIDCFVGDPCAIGTCGAEGVCEYTRREPCASCADDAGCAGVAPGAVCCGGACVRPCPVGLVLGKGCECQAPDLSGDGVVVIHDNGASNVGVTPEPPVGPTVVETPAAVTTVEEPPPVVTTES